MKTYFIQPTMTAAILTSTALAGKPASAAALALAAKLPPRQPLPRGVVDPNKPLLKLGLDVQLEFIMAVAQKDHANPPAPRKFTNDHEGVAA